MKLFLSFLALCLCLTLFRLTDMFYYYPAGYSDWILNTLLMGARFDALVLSFILIVVLISPWKKQIIFYVLWGFVAILNLINSLGFTYRGEHLWLQDWYQTEKLWTSESWGHKFISLVFAILVFYLGVRIFKLLVIKYQNTKLNSRILFFLFLLVFARGSLGKDHLRRNHCDGRPHKTIRSFCMNPAYTFLKTRNQEFP